MHSHATMKPLAIIPVVVFLLVAMNAAHVESRRSGMMYQLYVFGDSYADTGNVPKSNLSRESRQWYKPYGIGASSPSGRFSNRFVQSDFVASWLGHREAPQTFRLRNRNDITRFGMNFAVAGSGVLEVPEKVATLSKQVDNFEDLVKNRTFPPWRLRFSLALVAVSGNDYARIDMSSSNDTMALIETVTTGIAKEVQRLQDLGMNRILVNNMHPLGCTPLRTRHNNYTHCDDVANAVAATHNKLLAEKLGNYRGNVMLLDLNTAFSRVVQPNPNATPGSDDETLAKTFKNKLRPSCESFDPKGYCGQEDENGHPQYSVNDDLISKKDMFSNFYWDDVHPTHTAWFVAMMQLEEKAKAFLDFNN